MNQFNSQESGNALVDLQFKDGTRGATKYLQQNQQMSQQPVNTPFLNAWQAPSYTPPTKPPVQAAPTITMQQAY